MADAMVTARMSEEKKEAGNRILEKLGANASQAVNRLYDYVIEEKRLPFPEQEQAQKYTKEDIARAIACVDGISKKHATRFDDMTLKEAKRERLASRGLVDERGGL